ncbi:MAG: replicative DNA helicase [Clostridia bacterium]|nr:replicative DNA helicase [Clostridia bacterium]
MKQSPKILPNSLEAEQAVLACVLIDEEAPLNILAKLKADDFYSQAHKTIYQKMLDIYAENKPVDFVTLVDKLERANELETVGGLDYITSLTNNLPSASNFKHYLNIVKNHSKLRNLIDAGQKITEVAFEKENSQEAMAFAEKQIFDLAQSEDSSSLQHIEKGLKKVIDKFDLIAKDSSVLRGIPTGFKEFDHITNGLQNSDLILLAARPGVGKTSLAMNIINNSAITYGKKCAVFSLEMPLEQLAQRSLCSVACVSMEKALNGTLSEKDWQALWTANKTLNGASIFVDDNGLNTPMDILSKCRRLKREKGLDLVMIDYLQLMKSGLNTENRVLEISEITRNLKITAKELNIPIILLSQLSRAVETRNDHRPMLSDLRDSGAIEQDADIVLFIYNPAKYNDVVSEDGEGIIELEIAKHRNGSTGRIKLRWIGEWLSFVNKDKYYTNKQTNNENAEDITEMQDTSEIKEIFDQPQN